MPRADLDRVLADQEMLTDIPTYHVVGRRVAPEDLENRSFGTLQKSKPTPSGTEEAGQRRRVRRRHRPHAREPAHGRTVPGAVGQTAAPVRPLALW
ncbi:hypothetical protein [Streptomyces mutabilis]|uniref:Uncharacterized protein n=1 Tax=Streptomyces mutabilis TaxID=67332 RepID=A0A086MT25_9ACTN|nr:hypothetical protein [Streptomyces mutabilis]KFG72043.1 hypothetical protein FM21_31295 [Streptomyces mutabilis]